MAASGPNHAGRPRRGPGRSDVEPGTQLQELLPQFELLWHRERRQLDGGLAIVGRVKRTEELCLDLAGTPNRIMKIRTGECGATTVGFVNRFFGGAGGRAVGTEAQDRIEQAVIEEAKELTADRRVDDFIGIARNRLATADAESGVKVRFRIAFTTRFPAGALMERFSHQSNGS